MEKEKGEVISQIRALLVSTKGKCSLNQINYDYKMLMGSPIPYARFGHGTLDQFIRSIPTLAVSQGNGGQLFVDAKLDVKSAHIANLVNHQKEKKKSSSRRPPPRMYHNAKTPDMKWRFKNANSHLRKQYQKSPRLAAVSHNQFVNFTQASNPAPSMVQNRLVVSREVAAVSNMLKETTATTTKSATPKESPKSEPENAGSGDSLSAKARRRITRMMSDISLNNNSLELNGNALPLDSPSTSNISRNLFRGSASSIAISTPNPGMTPNPSLSRLNSADEYNTNLLAQNGLPRQNGPRNVEFTGDHLVDLKTFAFAHKLGEPVVKVRHRQLKKLPKLYDCSIKVAGHSFSSYPDDFIDERQAMQRAAKLALDELVPKYKSSARRQSLLISDDKDVLQRVPPIVRTHSGGVWHWQFELDYIDMFEEQLPINWLELIDTLPCISVVFSQNKFILHYCNLGEVLQKGVSMMASLPSNVSVPSNTVRFNSEGWLQAEITCPASACEIWCRQLNTAEAEEYDNMMPQFESYYNKNSHLEKVMHIEVGGYYVTSYDSQWFRIRVFNVENDIVKCFCIDFGDEVAVSSDTMFRLHRHFAKPQAQAFVCRLAGVEELYEASKTSDYLTNLVNKVVHVQLENNMNEMEMLHLNDPTLNVIMYNPETSETINEEMISYIGMESATSTLIKGTPTEVYVTHIEEDGSIYIQVRSVGYEQLTQLLSQLEDGIRDGTLSPPKEPVTRENSEGRLYLSKCAKDGCYYRTKIQEWSPYDNISAHVVYIDCGKSAVVKVKDHAMYPLDELSHVMSQFPDQAVRVRMDLANVPKGFVETVVALMPPDQPVLAKLVTEDKERGHVVEFFKRSETDNVLFSVNNALSIQTELKMPKQPPKSQKVQRLILLDQGEQSKNVPSSGLLSCPPLPKHGTYFEVTIPCAVNPYNFFVQPRVSRGRLNEMMEKLQQRYDNTQYSPLRVQDVQPGQIYASKHDDGMWYRTSVIKVIHSTSISVFYCDFGYYANLTIHQLVALDPEFMDLPYQALKAKLVGIKPKNSKWTMEDCKFFEMLVCKKSFVSVLRGIERDVLYHHDNVLSLTLVDTSTTEDVLIQQILISEGIAVE